MGSILCCYCERKRKERLDKFNKIISKMPKNNNPVPNYNPIKTTNYIPTSYPSPKKSYNITNETYNDYNNYYNNYYQSAPSLDLSVKPMYTYDYDSYFKKQQHNSWVNCQNYYSSINNLGWQMGYQ